MTERINIGNMSRNFSVKDQNGTNFNLSDYLGKRVLLSFHPLAWTSVCSAQMKSLEENQKSFNFLNTLAVGVSVDSVPCKKAWADSLGITNTALLSDFWPHGAVAMLHGIFRDKDGFSERANILVNENGKIVFARVYEIRQLPDINEIIGVIKNL